MSRGRPIDDVDRRIAGLLREDGRMSYARIAREVNLSEGAARQRVQRLLDEGAIEVIAVPGAKLVAGGVAALIGLRTSGATLPVAESLCALGETSSVMTTAGRLDVVAEVQCEDHAHLLAFLDEQVRSLPGVLHVEVLLCLRTHKPAPALRARSEQV